MTFVGQKIKILISYDGTQYSGWQKQKEQSSIQESLETAISKVFATPISIQGAGRTDAGVHAEGQVAHFIAPKDPKNYPQLIRAIQSYLPHDIAVLKAWQAPLEFDALRSATQKAYHYKIFSRKIPSPLHRRYYTWHLHPLNLAFLQSLCPIICGDHDFKSFQSTGTDVGTTVRTIYSANWIQTHEDIVEFHISGNGFLKQMVRNLVGTMLFLEHKDPNPIRMTEILKTLDRTKAGPAAPPQGLYLHQVVYPSELDNKCLSL